MNGHKRLYVAIALLALLVMVVACGGTVTKPTITLSPVGTQITAGQDVPVQSTASDSTGVVRVQFAVDGAPVADNKIDPAQKKIALQNTWKATAGQHTLSVQAFNAAGASSDLASLTVNVTGPAAPTAAPTAMATSTVPAGTATVAPAAVTNTAVVAKSNTPAPTPSNSPVPAPSATATAVPCTNNSAFVKHVTVPDGSTFKPNQQFSKTWQVQNNGTCTWTPSFSLAWVSGETLNGAQVIALPASVAPGQTIDLSVGATAPAAFGNHSGVWQLRDSKNAIFGVSLIVKIVTIPDPPQAAIMTPANGFQINTGTNIHFTFQGSSAVALSSVSLYAGNTLLSKQTPASPTNSVSAAFDWTPGAGNYDFYVVATDSFGQQTTSAHVGGSVIQQCQAAVNFRADRTTINRGESTVLRWDVDCVKAIYLDGGGVGGHETRNVAPANNQTWTLHIVKNDNNGQDFQVTINVNQPAPTAVPQQRRNISGNWTSGNFYMSLSEANGCGGPDCGVNGQLTESHGTMTPDQYNLNGSINVYNGNMTLGADLPGAPAMTCQLDGSSSRLTCQWTFGSLTFTR